MHEEYASDGFERAFAGGLYGLVLCVIGLLPGGWGHGTYLPIAVFGAPFGVLLGPLGLFACLAWWPVVAFTIGASRRPWLAMVLLLMHAAPAVAARFIQACASCVSITIGLVSFITSPASNELPADPDRLSVV